VPGKGAEQLGLPDVTRGNEFLHRCENLHPQTGKRLTLRQKTTHVEISEEGGEHQSADRRLFYDSTFSPLKSVWITAMSGYDTRIVEAHEQAVAEQMDLKPRHHGRSMLHLLI
jgi:hypothetical protein